MKHTKIDYQPLPLSNELYQILIQLYKENLKKKDQIHLIRYFYSLFEHDVDVLNLELSILKTVMDQSLNEEEPLKLVLRTLSDLFQSNFHHFNETSFDYVSVCLIFDDWSY